MVDVAKALQRLGYDYHDYAFLDTSAIPWGANTIGMYVVGTNANVVVPAPPNLAALMAVVPAPPGPATAIGPQYPWPYEGAGPAQAHQVPAATPMNPAPAQRTRILVVGQNDLDVWFLDRRLVNFLSAWFTLFPAAAALGPTAGAWPLPAVTPLIGGRESEELSQWIWMFFQRDVADADVDAHVWIEG